MKRIAIFLVFSLGLLGCMPELSESDQILQDAFENKQSDLQVEGKGTVVHLLSDDLEGSKHQRFIVELESSQTLLVAHNIDIAPRVDTLQKGESIRFYGEYEWNDEGGVIHWTHHDPDGDHVDGWLKYKGVTYQ